MSFSESFRNSYGRNIGVRVRELLVVCLFAVVFTLHSVLSYCRSIQNSLVFAVSAF